MALSQKSAYSIQLRAVPEDVKAIILQKQGEYKVKCRCQFSQEQTIYKMIRELAGIKEEKK